MFQKKFSIEKKPDVIFSRRTNPKLKTTYIVEIYENVMGKECLDTGKYKYSETHMIGKLYVEESRFPTLSQFWKENVASGKLVLDGVLTDFLTETQNKHYGDGMDTNTIKFIPKNSYRIKSLVLPKQTKFILNTWARARIIQNRKQINAKKIISNIMHYDLHTIMNRKPYDITQMKRYTITVPRQAIGNHYDELCRFIRLIPSATMTIDPFATIRIEMDTVVMRNVCGFFIDKKRKVNEQKWTKKENLSIRIYE